MYFNLNKKDKIYFEKIGNRNKTILILPGWGNTRETFKYITSYFSKDYTIYIIDYPGFGNSPTINKELTIYDYAQIINKLIKKEKIINPIIIAHSFGGRLSAILLGKYNLKVEKIILIDVAGIKRRKTLKQFLKEKTYKLINKLTKNKFKEKLNKYFASTDYNNLQLSMRKTFINIVNEDLRKYYKKINAETLIIWGEKDNDTPLKDGKYLNKIIKNSSLIIYKNRTHFSYLEEPFLTNKIIYELIKKED